MTDSRTAPRRDSALDALRMIAVLLMIASHSSRLIVWEQRRDWSRFSLLIEPLTASLFLILVGASLAHSWRAARAGGRGPWYRRQAMRAAALWAVSCVFYSLEDGFRLPDALTMSGILATIAYTSLLGMFLVSASRPAIGLAIVSSAMIGLHAWLDVNGLQVFVLNAGNSPLLPLTLFAILGALGVHALGSGWKVKASVLAAAAVSLAYILSLHGFTEVFSKPLGRYETIRTLGPALGPGSGRTEVPYYNLRPILVPMIVSLIVFLYAGLALLRPWLDRAGPWLLAMGRRSLDVYILHLSLLAILVVTGGKRPVTAAWKGDAMILIVIAICWAWVLGRDRWAKRRVQRVATQSSD